MRTSARLLPIRAGLDEGEAALYVGHTLDQFRKLVRLGKMPRPRVSSERETWDVDELLAAYRNLPHKNEIVEDTWADFDGRHKATIR